MASTDWLAITDGPGSSAIVDDSANGAPSTTSLNTLGFITYQNITGGSLLDSQVTFWSKEDVVPYLIALRAQDTLYGTGDRYAFTINASDGGVANIVFAIRRDIAGSGTNLLLASTPAFGGARSKWQRWRFSCVTLGGNVLLRVEQWNGASFDVVGDVTDIGVNKILTPGNARFGNASAGNATPYFDDFQISSLA